jgi:hypothetical protein
MIIFRKQVFFTLNFNNNFQTAGYTPTFTQPGFTHQSSVTGFIQQPCGVYTTSFQKEAKRFKRLITTTFINNTD